MRERRGRTNESSIRYAKWKGDLRAIDDFADALALVSETMEENPHANAINRLAWEIKHRAQSAERRRAICLGSNIQTVPNKEVTPRNKGGLRRPPFPRVGPSQVSARHAVPKPR